MKARNLLLLVGLLVPWPLLGQSMREFPRLTIVGPTVYANAEEINPHPIFKQWWNQLKECAGEHAQPDRTFEQLSFYEADNIWNTEAGISYWGVYYERPPEIVVVRRASNSRRILTMMHELLHHMTANGEHAGGPFKDCLPEGANSPGSPPG
jgi:hypothetical protein